MMGERIRRGFSREFVQRIIDDTISDNEYDVLVLPRMSYGSHFEWLSTKYKTELDNGGNDLLVYVK